MAWLASPRADRVSGQVLQVWGGEVVVYETPRRNFEAIHDGPWTFEALDAHLGLFFADQEPVVDGFGLNQFGATGRPEGADGVGEQSS